MAVESTSRTQWAAAVSKATSSGFLVVADVHVGKAMSVSEQKPQDWSLSGSNGWLVLLAVMAVAALVLVGAMYLYELVTDADFGASGDLMDMMGLSPPLGLVPCK